MPTLPLYDSTATGNAWHGVYSPGGWEWWLFQVESDDRSLSFSVGFFTGYPSADYRRAYHRYIRHPIRHAPPRPIDFAAVRIDRSTKPEILRYPAGAFSGSSTSPQIAIASNRIIRADDGSLFVRAGEVGRIEMRFIPDSPLREIEDSGLLHRVGIERASVDGTIFSSGKSISFRGHGGHRYQFGLTLLELPGNMPMAGAIAIP